MCLMTSNDLACTNFCTTAILRVSVYLNFFIFVWPQVILHTSISSISALHGRFLLAGAVPVHSASRCQLLPHLKKRPFNLITINLIESQLGELYASNHAEHDSVHQNNSKQFAELMAN